MLRKFVCAAIVLVLVGGVALAETVRGLITKIEDGKIEVSIGKKGEEPTTKTFTIKDAKIKKAKGFKKDAETEDATIEDLKKAVADAKEALKKAEDAAK